VAARERRRGRWWRRRRRRRQWRQRRRLDQRPARRRLPAELQRQLRLWAKSIDFTKMTHLNLAFVSATSSNGWDMGASDSDVQALVDAAHAKGVKVLASLGGGGGDQTVIAQYKNTSNIAPLVSNLTRSSTATTSTASTSTSRTAATWAPLLGCSSTPSSAKLRPSGKLVTAAVAQYLQDSMADDDAAQFDFVNVMIYSSYNESVSA
jgi:chitinase